MLKHARLSLYDSGQVLSMQSLSGLPHVVIVIRGFVSLANHARPRTIAGPGALLGFRPGLLNMQSFFQITAHGAVVLAYLMPIDEIKVGRAEGWCPPLLECVRLRHVALVRSWLPVLA